MPHRRGITLIEILAIVVIVIVLIALILPSIYQVQYTHGIVIKCMVNIKQQLVAFHAYASDNNDYFPGIDAQGEMANASVSYRYEAIKQYFPNDPFILICSQEDQKKIPFTTDIPIQNENYSYALLNLSCSKILIGRKTEKDSSFAKIPLISDRAIAVDDQKLKIRSTHSKYFGETELWIGHVGWLDGHTQQFKTPTISTGFVEGQLNINDFLFDNIDASMVYRGVDELIDPGDAK